MLVIFLSITLLSVVILVGIFCFNLYKKNNALLKENMNLVNINPSLEQKILEIIEEKKVITEEKMVITEENKIITQEKTELMQQNMKLATKLEYETKQSEELKNNKESLSLKIKDIENELRKSQTENAKWLTTLEYEKKQVSQKTTDLMQENTNLLTMREYEKKQFEELKNNRDLISLKFKEISHEIIKTQTKEFQAEQFTSMKTHLDPLKTDIQVFKTQIDQMTKEQRDGRVSLGEHIKVFQQGHLSLQKEAENLAKALRGNTKMQGDWGEMQLEKLLQMTGLKEGVEYTKQEWLGLESGNLRPDYIIKLPDGKSIILDSKVSLNNYLNYIQAETAEEKKDYFKKYIRDIREHITSLSSKDYSKWLKGDSLDFVCMYLPLELAYIEALKEDNTLYQSAYNNHIVIITSSSFLPILRMVQLMWRTVKRNENVEHLAQLGGDLHHKLVNFVENFLKIDNALQSAHGSYNKAMRQLNSGNGNAISLAQKMASYGAKIKKDFPSELSDGNISDENTLLFLKEPSDISSSEQMDFLEEEIQDTVDI